MAKAKNPHRIRGRVTSKGVLELWLGNPGEPESECIGQFHKEYLPSVIDVLNEVHKLPVIESNKLYGIKPEQSEKEYSSDNGFLPRGATKCPDCNVSLHWQIVGLIRLFNELAPGKYFYNARCPSCRTTWAVRK